MAAAHNAAVAEWADHPRRDVYVGAMAKVLSLDERLDRMLRQQLARRPDRGQSNLDASPNETRIDGDFTRETRRR